MKMKVWYTRTYEMTVDTKMTLDEYYNMSHEELNKYWTKLTKLAKDDNSKPWCTEVTTLFDEDDAIIDEV